MLEIIKDYKKIIVGIVLAILVGIISFLSIKSNKDEIKSTEQNIEKVEKLEKKEEVEEVIEEVKPIKYLNVDVKGAVKKPGIYSLEEGSIVNDVIKKAGLKSNASTKNINLSKKIVDEMVIYIYTTKELSNTVINEPCICNDVNISSCEGSSVIIPGDDTSTNTDIVSSKVNINKATKEELMTLSGIGEAKAIAIIKYREDNNGFKDVSEIMNISGIGESLYNKIKDYITI